MSTSVTFAVEERQRVHEGIERRGPSRGELTASSDATWQQLAEKEAMAEELMRLAAEHGIALTWEEQHNRRTTNENAHHYDGGLDYLITDVLDFVANGGAEAIKAFLVASMAPLTVWLKMRGSRSVTLTTPAGSVELKGMSADDAMKLARELNLAPPGPVRKPTTPAKSKPSSKAKKKPPKA